MNSRKRVGVFAAFFALAFFALLSVPVGQAHEVYVLNATTIASDLAVERVNVADALDSPGAQQTFIRSVIFGVLAAIIVSYLIHTKFSKHLDDRFQKLRPYAHLVIRIGLGISFLWGAYHNSIFGPELPMTQLLGGMAWKPIMLVVGIMLIFGLMTRVAAFVGLLAFLTVAVNPGRFDAFYMMNYLNYLGEIVVLLLERGTKYSLDEYLKWPAHIFHHRLPHWIRTLERFGEQHSFLIIRVCFGIALIWAAISIKILHPKLSLDVLTLYHLDEKVAFTTLFVVFAAGIIEILLGLVLITGVMYRPGLFVTVFFIGYSVWFFGEEVWPHVILVALAVGLFIHGKDKWCYEDKFYNTLWGWTKRFRKSTNALSPK